MHGAASHHITNVISERCGRSLCSVKLPLCLVLAFLDSTLPYCTPSGGTLSYTLPLSFVLAGSGHRRREDEACKEKDGGGERELHGVGGRKAAERLANKIILITGASSGIGEATAREFALAANGKIKLILTARRHDRLTTLSESLLKEFPDIKIHSAKLDVTAKDTIRPFITGLPSDFADIDVLINNAGKALGKAQVGEIEDEDIEGMFQTNVIGLINVTQAILPIFKAKNSGDIVNIGSVAGRDPYPGGAVYCASKSAVNFFTHALRKELINTKIRVLEVDPGAVLTEFSLVRFKGDSDQADSVYTGTQPLGPEDIAESVVFGVSRRQNTVIAETLVFPQHQASASHVYRSG